MAQQPGPQPPPSIPLTDHDQRLSLSWRQYMQALDAAIRGWFGKPSTLVSVAAPSNTNAATAGVLVGQLYRDTADPAKFYIRTV